MGTKFGAKAAHFLMKQCIESQQANGESDYAHSGKLQIVGRDVPALHYTEISKTSQTIDLWSLGTSFNG